MAGSTSTTSAASSASSTGATRRRRRRRRRRALARTAARRATGRARLASAQNAHLPTYEMNHGRVQITLVQESLHCSRFTDRLVPLDDNPLVLPLPRSPADDPRLSDPVGLDLADIPRALQAIQDDWNSGVGLNRLTAWHFGRQLKDRLRRKADGRAGAGAVDILVTGCEVSLWLGEQFAADLSMMFKKLHVRTLSSNKLLGLLGQDFPIPQTGHAFSEDQWDLHDAIVIIVSHSGGTFAPLAVSNLMQSFSQHIFVVTSEWDTQIGKQLRQLDSRMFESRIFSTDLGVRPAEPCSVSVAATQQLLTHASSTPRSSSSRRRRCATAAGAAVTDVDLAELERCSRETIGALETIVGFDRRGQRLRAGGGGDGDDGHARGRARAARTGRSTCSRRPSSGSCARSTSP